MKEIEPIKRLKEVLRVRQNQKDWEKRWDFPYAGDTSVFEPNVFEPKKPPLDKTK